MEILFVLVPLALVLSALALFGFFRAVEGGQFEDLEGDGARFLLDDESQVDRSVFSQSTPGERHQLRP